MYGQICQATIAGYYTHVIPFSRQKRKEIWPVAMPKEKKIARVHVCKMPNLKEVGVI